MKNVTIVDVAEAAGVTAMTVSRVMKGYKHVSPKTREKVLRVAGEMNYTVNMTARALVTGQTGIIAVITEHLNHPYFANLIHHLELQLASQGYVMRLLYTDEELDSLVHSTKSSAVDGIIVAGLHGRVQEYLRRRTDESQPCVFISPESFSEADYIRIDFRPALTEAIQLMITAGRKRIAYVGIGTLDFPHQMLHWEGRPSTYRDEMEKAGRRVELIGVNPSIEIDSPARIEALKDYFQTNGCPDGLVCFHDEIALHVFRALTDLGYRIPDEVMLVGCDDLPFMKFIEPPLSSIAEPMAEICALAWKFLQMRIAAPDLPLQCATITPQLMVRKSLLA